MESNFDVKILVIDDEEDVRDVIKRNLEKYGYQNITMIGSLKEAKEKFESEHFDIMTVDMRMDGNDDGFGVLEYAKDDKPIASNMIIFTANDTVLDCRKAFKMGAWDYIPKRIVGGNGYEELHNSIQEAIAHTKEWGNSKDTTWISEHIDELIERYNNKYVAIMDGKVIAEAATEEELEKILRENNEPTVMPMVFKVQ